MPEKSGVVFKWVPGSPVFQPERLLGGSYDFDDLPFFSYGRYGLLYTLKYLQQRAPATRVLIPSYMCHEVLQSLRDFDFEIDFYRITPELQVDTADLEARLVSGRPVVAVVVFQPFGHAISNFAELEKVLSTHSAPVIEDCAHLPFPFQLQPDFKPRARVYTLRKTYPLPYGAVVDFGSENQAFKRELGNLIPLVRDENYLGLTRWLVAQEAKRAVMKAGIPMKREYRDLSQDPLKPFNLPLAWVKRLIPRSETLRAVTQRRRNYQAYQAYFRSLDGWASPLEFNDRDVPYQMLLTLRQNIDPERVIQLFLQSGIGAVKGLALDQEVIQGLPTDHPFLRQVALPIHQGISTEQIDHVGRVFERIRTELV